MTTYLDRRELEFARLASEAFAFMNDHGFVQTEVTPTIIRFTKGDLLANVYHGRISYELGFEIGRGDEQFSLGAMIRISDQATAARYRSRIARTMPDVAAGVQALADLVQRYGLPALSDDAKFFEELRQQRKVMTAAFAREVFVHQTRPKAEAAFKKRAYVEAVMLYEQIRDELTPLEQKKLEFARAKRGSSRTSSDE